MKTGGGATPLVGSSPTASAWGHGPTGRRQHGMLEIRVQLPATPLERHGPVVQRQRLLAHNQETMVRLHPGPLWLGRQPADHLGLKPGMLWVRLPPEPLKKIESSWSSLECSLACHARDRGFKSRRGRSDEMARYANGDAARMKWRGTQIGKAAKLKPW